jgi:hypothetical protein
MTGRHRARLQRRHNQQARREAWGGFVALGAMVTLCALALLVGG